MNDKTIVLKIGIPIEASDTVPRSAQLALDVYQKEKGRSVNPRTDEIKTDTNISQYHPLEFYISDDYPIAKLHGTNFSGNDIPNYFQPKSQGLTTFASFLTSPVSSQLSSADSNSAPKTERSTYRSRDLFDKNSPHTDPRSSPENSSKSSLENYTCFFTPLEQSSSGPDDLRRQALKKKLDLFYEPSAMGEAFQYQSMTGKASCILGSGVAFKTFYDRPNLLATASLIPASQLADDFYSLQTATEKRDRFKYTIATTADAFALAGSATHFAEKVPAFKSALSKVSPYGKPALLAGIFLKVASNFAESNLEPPGSTSNSSLAGSQLKTPFRIDFNRLTPEATPQRAPEAQPNGKH